MNKLQLHTYYLRINVLLLSCFRPKFGIYGVDFNDQNRSRFPKKSTQFFKLLFQTKTLPDVLDDLYSTYNYNIWKVDLVFDYSPNIISHRITDHAWFIYNVTYYV